MGHQIRVEINGQTYEREVEPRRLLVHFLREDLELTGTNVGCETSLCGACTVLVDGVPILSCLTLAASVAGTKLLRSEGIIAPSDRVVCILTGHQLKDPTATVALAIVTPAFTAPVGVSNGGKIAVRLVFKPCLIAF